MEGLANGKCKVLDLFKYPTIRSLAEFLGNGDESESPQNSAEEIHQRELQRKASRRKQASKRKREVPLHESI